MFDNTCDMTTMLPNQPGQAWQGAQLMGKHLDDEIGGRVEQTVEAQTGRGGGLTVRVTVVDIA